MKNVWLRKNDIELHYAHQYVEKEELKNIGFLKPNIVPGTMVVYYDGEIYKGWCSGFIYGTRATIRSEDGMCQAEIDYKSGLYASNLSFQVSYEYEYKSD